MESMTTNHCPACGVVVPKRIGRCPSCQAWLGRRLVTVGLAGAFVAAIFAWTLIRIRAPGATAAPRVSVQITPGIAIRSPDNRGTDALATVANLNPVPVDVTVRVRGFDITDRPV